MPAYKFTALPPGKLVTVKKADGTTAGTGTVDSNGTLTITLDAGDYSVTTTDYRGRTVTAVEQLATANDPDVLASSSGTYETLGGQPASALWAPAPNRKVLYDFQSGHGWTHNWGATAPAYEANATTDPVFGTQYARVVTAGDGTTRAISRGSGVLHDFTNKNVGLLLYVENLSALARITVEIGSSGFAAFYRHTVWDGSAVSDLNQEFLEQGRWIWVDVPWNPVFTSGSPTATTRQNIAAYQISVTDRGGGTGVAVRFAALSSRPIPTGYGSNGAFVISLDDGFASHATAIRELGRRGVPANLYPVTDVIGTSGYMTVENLQEAQDRWGCMVGVHAASFTVHSPAYATISDVAREADITAVRKFLNANGLKGVDHFAYPNGLCNGGPRATAARHFASARTTASRTYEVLPPTDTLKTRAQQLTSGSNFTFHKTQIDSAYANNWTYEAVFHDLVTSGPTGIQATHAQFLDLVDYAIAKGIPIRTTEQLAAVR